MVQKKLRLNIVGMHCSGCEKIIEDAVSKLPGITKIVVRYDRETAEIEFDADQLDLDTIQQCIEDSGYQILHAHSRTLHHFINIGLFSFLLLLVGGVAFWGKSLMPEILPQIHTRMSHAIIFGIGVLTGFHCIGMCGSFVIGYSKQAPTLAKSILAHFTYGVGKTASYALFGALFGFIGSAITITMNMRGIASLAASIFLLLYGLKMLGLVHGLRHLSIRLPRSFNKQLSNQLGKRRSPMLIGLLSGLILGCGPLQAMYIMAAGTGDPLGGAVILTFFGLGTLVPLLGLGLFANILPASVVHQLVKVSGLLVIVMALMMANRGLKMTRSGYDLKTILSTLQQPVSTSSDDNSDTLAVDQVQGGLK